MPATATIIRDSGPGSNRNVVVDFSDDDGFINRAHVRLPAGTDAQVWGDLIAPRRTDSARQAEMEEAIAQCVAGTAPADIVRTRITLPKLWERMTRRLHNGPRRGLDADTMRGLAQHVVTRANSTIRNNLNGVRTNAQVNALKNEWNALINADVTAFDEVDEDD